MLRNFLRDSRSIFLAQGIPHDPGPHVLYSQINFLTFAHTFVGIDKENHGLLNTWPYFLYFRGQFNYFSLIGSEILQFK